MKLVHAADLHLDSPLTGLGEYEHAPLERLKLATRQAFHNLIELTLAEGAKLLLLAGDLWDVNWPDYSTGLLFAAEMSKLRAAGVRVVWIRGNHDAQSRITRGLSTLPDNVHELSTKRPETVEVEDVAIHGQGFATGAVQENLAQAYPAPRPGLVNIGLLHTSVTGRAGHASYAPCTLSDLIDKGYDYWALGHVHQREVLSERPWIVFPGNTQGRHARETGAKGATVVQIEDGRIQSVEPRTLDVVRWSRCDVDASEARTFDDALDLVERALRAAHAGADGRLLAARVVVRGRSPAHAELVRHAARFDGEVRALASRVALDELFLEKVQISTAPEVDWSELRARDDAIGQVFRGLDELRRDEPALLGLAREIVEARRKLDKFLVEVPGEPKLDDPEHLRELLEDVERELLPRLLGEGGVE
jgi:DNA repair exonuclease SbcCD nuclease subunit